MRYAYTYDDAGNITVKDTEHGVYNYGYDGLDRLTSAQYPTYNEVFNYDKVGNRTALNNSTPWAYNINNELTARPTITYQYDANGSQTQKTENGIITDYVYDSSNRLIEVKQGTTIIASYQHDPFGRRISKTVSGVTTYFYYTDEGLTAEADSAGAGAITQSYGYAPNSTWGTNPLYTSANGSYHYYLNDHLGTPQQLAAKNGAKSWEAMYEAFGKATVTSSSVTNNLRFPGQYADAETGFHYNFHRTYDDQIGRYIKSDPIGKEGGINLFGYSSGSPIMHSDPRGLTAAAPAAAIALCVRSPAACGAIALAICKSLGMCSTTVPETCEPENDKCDLKFVRELPSYDGVTKACWYERKGVMFTFPQAVGYACPPIDWERCMVDTSYIKSQARY